MSNEPTTNKQLELCKKYNIDPKKPILYKNSDLIMTILWDIPVTGRGSDVVAVTYLDGKTQNLSYIEFKYFVNKPDYTFVLGDIIYNPESGEKLFIYKSTGSPTLYYLSSTKGGGNLMELYTKFPKGLIKIANINELG